MHKDRLTRLFRVKKKKKNPGPKKGKKELIRTQ